MSGLDWTVLVVYLAAMVGLSIWLSRGQTNTEDYYVGGRNLPWWAVGISTMATQTSANSFIGIPAYVALKEGGGLTWLQYELAVPLALVFVMIFLIPLFRDLELVSVYEYLEMRFDRRTRLVMSGVFLLSRGLGTGVGVYASAVVVSVCIGLPIWQCILLIGVVTVIYDTLGGMAAVVYSDVIQMVVLIVGLFACVWIAIGDAGGIAEIVALQEPARLEGIDMHTGVGDGAQAPFWGFLVGGFVLYVSYYGVDQSQAQRELSAPTTADTKRSLVFNALARFPMTVLYVLMGLAVGAVYLESPELRASVPADNLDYLVPHYILQHLPSGLRGVLFAAILAAAMSSLDSALNSLSAATMRDFVEPHFTTPEDPVATQASMLRWSKVTTVAWGAAMTGFAFLVGDMADNVVEGINKVGSLFYGPILAAFMAGILDRRSRGNGVIAGVAVGVLANMWLWLSLEDGMFWMWWNLTGLVVAAVTTAVVSRALPPPDEAQLEKTTLKLSEIPARESSWLRLYGWLFIYFLFIVFIAAKAPDILQSLGTQ
jgi:SSS family solute:Na+ symporter